MLIEAGPEGVASFTDESSPDSRLTARVKVSVNAQVLRHEPLDWYFALISYFPDVPGELRSEAILSHFSNLPGSARLKIWSGLSKVRVHISDPRPYIEEVNRALGKIMRQANARESLRQRANQK